MSIDGPAHATSTHSMPRRTLPRDSSSVFPCSVVTSVASSSKWSSRSALNRNIARARTTGGVWLQPVKAFVAAATATSTSRPVDSGVRAITVPRAGLCTSRNSDADEGIHLPSTKLDRISACTRASPCINGPLWATDGHGSRLATDGHGSSRIRTRRMPPRTDADSGSPRSEHGFPRTRSDLRRCGALAGLCARPPGLPRFHR